MRRIHQTQLLLVFLAQTFPLCLVDVQNISGLGNEMTVKSAGSEFGCQHPHRCSHPLVTPVPGEI